MPYDRPRPDTENVQDGEKKTETPAWFNPTPEEVKAVTDAQKAGDEIKSSTAFDNYVLGGPIIGFLPKGQTIP
jgi:hypothetical protein